MTLKNRHLRGAQLNRTMYSGVKKHYVDFLFLLF